jgi:hypothetical protein
MLTNRKSILFRKYKEDRKSAEYTNGKVQKDPLVKQWELELAEAEALVAVLDPLVWTYIKFSEVASREVTARANEQELEGLTGQRKRRIRS